MALSAALQELSAVVEGVEQDGYVVENIIAPGEQLVNDDAVTAELSVQIPFTSCVSEGQCAEVKVDGCDDQGMISTDLSVRIPLDAVEESGTHIRQRRSEGLPRYKDPEALRRVYEKYETFEKMTEELDVDVSPSTVRRHMIKHNVHEPEPMYDDEAQDTTVGSDGDDSSLESEQESTVQGTTRGQSVEGADVEEPNPDSDSENESSKPTAREPEPLLENKQLVTDGIGLPENLTLEDMIEIVGSSSTIFEVRRKMDVDHDRAKRVLQALDLIDLVTGRISKNAERDVSEDVIADRIETVIQGKTVG